MLIKNTKDLKDGPLTILVYGQSGAGKTTLTKTLPGAPGKILVISAESGLLPLQEAGIDYVDITRNDKDELLPKESRIARVGEVYNYLQTAEAKAKYDWIVFDSLTEIGQVLVDSLQVKHAGSKDGYAVYRENLQMLRSMITKFFRDQDHYNSLILTLSERGKNAEGIQAVNIDLEGRMSQSAPQFFDCVFLLGVQPDGKRILMTATTERYIAKDRSGKLLQMEDADLGKIIGKIRTPAVVAVQKPAVTPAAVINPQVSVGPLK